MNDCLRTGHRWSTKTDSHGRLVKVCMSCGTDELREAVSVLRYLQTLCRDSKPVGQWPGDICVNAIDTVLNHLDKAK